MRGQAPEESPQAQLITERAQRRRALWKRFEDHAVACTYCGLKPCLAGWMLKAEYEKAVACSQ